MAKGGSDSAQDKNLGGGNPPAGERPTSLQNAKTGGESTGGGGGGGGGGGKSGTQRGEVGGARGRKGQPGFEQNVIAEPGDVGGLVDQIRHGVGQEAGSTEKKKVSGRGESREISKEGEVRGEQIQVEGTPDVVRGIEEAREVNEKEAANVREEVNTVVQNEGTPLVDAKGKTPPPIPPQDEDKVRQAEEVDNRFNRLIRAIGGHGLRTEDSDNGLEAGIASHSDFAGDMYISEADAVREIGKLFKEMTEKDYEKLEDKRADVTHRYIAANIEALKDHLEGLGIKLTVGDEENDGGMETAESGISPEKLAEFKEKLLKEFIAQADKISEISKGRLVKSDSTLYTPELVFDNIIGGLQEAGIISASEAEDWLEKVSAPVTEGNSLGKPIAQKPKKK